MTGLQLSIMSLAIKRYCDSVGSSSEQAYRIYKSRLSSLSDFAKKKYQGSADILIQELRAGDINVYVMLTQFIIFLDRYGDANKTISNKVTTARSFLESCDIKCYVSAALQ